MAGIAIKINTLKLMWCPSKNDEIGSQFQSVSMDFDLNVQTNAFLLII